MPNIVVNAFKRLLLAIFFVSRLFLRILTCQYFRRPKRIGELPTYISGSESAQFGIGTYSPMNPISQSAADSTWSNWSEQSNGNSAVSEQIEEYRRRRQEELLAEKAAKKRGHPHGGVQNGPMANGGEKAAEKNGEPDLFAEMQPKVKAPKKLVMRQNRRSDQELANQRQTMFQVQEEGDAYFGNGEEVGEFGELTEMEGTSGGREKATSWLDEDDNVDLDELDEFEREQRRKERDERKMKRQIEHAQQLEEKRKKRPMEHRIQF